MRDFFNGWRRQVGCVTLVMACLVTIAWMRSLVVCGLIATQSGWGAHFAMSTRGRVAIWTLPGGVNTIWSTTPVEGDWAEPAKSRAVEYWRIAVPLVLLSAYLIHWKPRKRKAESDA